MGSISLGKPMTTQPHQKKPHDGIKKAFLTKEWNSFHLSGKKLNYLHLKDFLKYECELYLKQPLAPPQCKIIVAYHTSNHELAIEIGRWIIIPISRDTRLCNFCSYNGIEMSHISCWNVPYITPLQINFHHYVKT